MLHQPDGGGVDRIEWKAGSMQLFVLVLKKKQIRWDIEDYSRCKPMSCKYFEIDVCIGHSQKVIMILWYSSICYFTKFFCKYFIWCVIYGVMYEAFLNSWDSLCNLIYARVYMTR